MQLMNILLLIFIIPLHTNLCLAASDRSDNDNETVKLFQEYLRIDTSKPENIQAAASWWMSAAAAAGLRAEAVAPAGLPVVVITLPGRRDLPAIMLNSHMDVVPADAEDWKYPPFSGHMDDSGDIYGRGAQDTKAVAIQYFEAMKRIKQSDTVLDRTLHMTLMPDEEAGGARGMRAFIASREFRELRVGFALDEGVTSLNDTMYVTYVDKRTWQIKFTVHGKSGHGSIVSDDIAMIKAVKLMNAILEFRKKQEEAAIGKSFLDYGDVTAVNINMINGGRVANVIPSSVDVVVDVRLAVGDSVRSMEELVASWSRAAGGGVTVTYLTRDDAAPATPVDASNRYWRAMQDALAEMNTTVVPIVCAAKSDAAALRARGVPALGFAPATRTARRLHARDEYLAARTLLRGVAVYEAVLRKLGNLP